jgi:hypothetical protein
MGSILSKADARPKESVCNSGITTRTVLGTTAVVLLPGPIQIQRVIMKAGVMLFTAASIIGAIAFLTVEVCQQFLPAVITLGMIMAGTGVLAARSGVD